MKRCLVLLLVSFYSSVSFSQITFQRSVGGASLDNGNSIQLTADGGYMIAGITSSFGAGIGDIYLVKIDAIGQTQWTKTFGGTGVDYALKMQNTYSNGYIITGYVPGFGTADDAFLIHTDSNGDTLWTRKYAGGDTDRAHDVKQTADSGFVICGFTESSGSGNQDALVIKTDAAGNMQWAKTYGSFLTDVSHSVVQTADGGYAAAGQTANAGAGQSDAFLIRLDATGDTLWTRTYGGTAGDVANSIIQTPDGGFALLGFSASFGTTGNNVYLLKTDQNGSLLWSKTYGGPGNDTGYLLKQTSDGGYILTAYTSSFTVDMSGYLIKTDATGAMSWSKRYSGSGDFQLFSVSETADGGFAMTGLVENSGAGLTDVYLLKSDSLGNTGCNEAIPNTVTSTPATITSGYSPDVDSAAITETFPAITIGTGGIDSILCLQVSVEEIHKNNSLVVYPNPSTGDITIELEDAVEPYFLEITDVTGHRIDSFTKEITGNKISIQNLNAGIYFLKIKSNEKYYPAKKISVVK